MSESLGYNTVKSGTDCTWIEADDIWGEAFYTWLDACFKGGGGTTAQLTRIRKGRKELQRKFCKLVAEIKGEEYEETKYFQPEVQVIASDFKIIERFLAKPELSIFINKRN